MKSYFRMAMAIAIVLCALVGLAASVEQNQTSENKDLSIEELAIRFLQEFYADGSELDEIKLLPGRLPQEMPVDLPIPKGARIAGSMTQDDNGVYLILDVPMTPDQALDFYREHLGSKNWTEMDLLGMNQGFVEGGNPSTSFCQGLKNPWIIVTAHPEENGTDLRFSISSDPECSPCSQDSYNDWLKPIPKLAAPKGAKVSGENSLSGSGYMVAASATLETEINSSTLAAHYADQLKAANWTVVSEGESGSSSWSSWSYNDEDGQAWDGFFMARELPETNGKKKAVLMQANIMAN